MADVARGQPERLRCDRKLPLMWPDPSQPGVGQVLQQGHPLLHHPPQHYYTVGFIIIIIKGICIAPTWSLSVRLITLKCYPGFLGLFPVKEEEEKENYTEPPSLTDMLSCYMLSNVILVSKVCSL